MPQGWRDGQPRQLLRAPALQYCGSGRRNRTPGRTKKPIKKDAPLKNRLTKNAPYKGGMHRSARVRCGQADQGQEAAYSRRYAGSVAARHRSFRRHSGSRWRHPVAGHAVRSVSIPREAVCRQRLSRTDFCERARQNPALISKPKSSNDPITPKDSSNCPSVGSSNARSPGSTAAVVSPRIGKISTATPSRS